MQREMVYTPGNKSNQENKVSEEAKSLSSSGYQGITFYTGNSEQDRGGRAGKCSIGLCGVTGRGAGWAAVIDAASLCWAFAAGAVCWGGPGAAMHQLQLVMLLFNRVLSPVSHCDTSNCTGS